MNLEEMDRKNSECVKSFHQSLIKLNNAMKHLNETQSKPGVEHE